MLLLWTWLSSVYEETVALNISLTYPDVFDIASCVNTHIIQLPLVLISFEVPLMTKSGFEDV